MGLQWRRAVVLRTRARLLVISLLSCVVFAVAGASSASAMSLAAAWGLNDDGQLGNGSTTGPEHCLVSKIEHACSITPLLVSEASEVTAVAAGKSHSLALLSNGTVEAWGRNSSGQLGIGTTVGSDVPVPVASLSEVTAIAAGTVHSLALLSNGTVEAWGGNETGELGNGTTTSSDVPVTVTGLSGVVAIAAGDGYSLALLKNGTVEAWGLNEVGELGSGTSTGPEHCLFNNVEHPCSTKPIAVTSLTGVTAISAGFAHSLALLATGTVKSWGFNNFGQLGDGTSSGPQSCNIKEFQGETIKEFPVACSTKPVSVSGLTEARAIAAGEAHSLAAKVGSVQAWGENEEGELGNSTTNESDLPVTVTGLGEVSAIAAGGRTSMALLPDGTTRAWGGNVYGQLGDGTLLERLKPTLVCGLTGVLSIATRGGHSLAATTSPPRCPAVTSISPIAGSSAGGTSVTITGTNLAEATEVRFGKAKATSFMVESPTTITAVSPPGSGSVDITVTSPLGTSPTSAADRFTYQAPPSVIKVVPNSGPTSGGTPVTITGSGFTEATEVLFGGTPATSFTIESATTIKAVSPVHASGTVDVTVTNPVGTSTTKLEDHFTFLQLEAPELGRCVKVGVGLGAYASANCTATGGERKYEWFPGFGVKPLVKKRYTQAIKSLTSASLTTPGGLTVTCTGQTGEGEYVAAKAVAGVAMTFTGCHRGEIGKCESSGAAEGEVKTSLLNGVLGIVKVSTEAVKDKIGLDLSPASGETVMEFTCAGVPVRVTGSLIVEVKANSMLSKATLKYSGTGGVQKPSRFESGPEDVLISTLGEGSPETSVLTLTTIQTNEERVEVNSVV
jgi:alpha-tubulin suppressor-like RCC1 family protein